MSRCALGRVRSSRKTSSCFTSNELNCMVSAWNLLNMNDTIDITSNLEADDLWQNLSEKLKNTNERQWLDNATFMNKVQSICPDLAGTIKYLAFRPFFMIASGDLWLSQKDINHCIIQLLHSFRKCVSDDDAIYLGAQPVDFFTNHPKSSKIPYSQDWGVILNTVSQQEGGEHWVAMFHAKNTLTLEFFDSSGESPSDRLMNVLNVLKNRNKYIKTVKISDTVHQEDEYNCGVYTILFLFLRYIAISFEKIEAEKLGFDHIHQFRDLLFDH